MRDGEVWCDLAYKVIRYGNKSVRLTKHEYGLCLLLSAHVGHVKSRDQILDTVYPMDYDKDPRSVDSHVKRSRAKMRAALGYNPIRTHCGLGYYWENPPK